jgi:intein/homing endonuclease
MADLIITGRILGIFWTTASWSSTEETIQITNKDYEIVKEVQSYLAKLGFEYTIFQGPTENKRPGYEYDYYRMKIRNYYIISELRKKYNWRGQREEERYYPEFVSEQQEIDFLKYYIDDQGHFDYMNTKRGQKKRYRVWANYNFAYMLSERISKIVGVNQNKPQEHKQSDITMTIYYQSQKDVPLILDFINSA